jgi:hypothetical protein
MPSCNSQRVEKSNRQTVTTVSFKEFAALARRRSWTSQALADRFRGRIDSPADFFARVLSGKFPDNLIPYRSVLEFYTSAQTAEPSGGRRECACGCNRTVFDRKRYALSGCKKKAAREKVRDVQNRSVKPLDFVDARRGQNRRVGPLLSTGARRRENGL